MKLGQFLATRPDVVGTALARDLESLQDHMPPFGQAEAEAAVIASFDKPVETLFASFGPPVAAASIAQVHRASVATATGQRPVAVKILRPGVERRFHADLAAFTFAATRAENVSAEARRLRLVEVVDTLRRTVRQGWRRASWPTRPMAFRLRATPTGAPSTATIPAAGWSRPESRRRSVVFPTPLRLTTATTSPGATSKATPRKTSRAP